jgi:anthranilate synthase component 2
MKILIIDNYDSFTFNLYQYIGEILNSDKYAGKIEDFEITVRRNDAIDLAGVKAYAPDRIIISPGPGSPDDDSYFGVCAEVIRHLGPQIPLLGVCLGMQGIVHVFGGRVVKAPTPMHGKTSLIQHTGTGLFAGIPNNLEIMRYHSLIAEAESLPNCLDITSAVGDLPVEDFTNRKKVSVGGDFEIMGIKHREYPIYGIQFHPESFATEGGREMIRNFLYLKK